MRLSWLVSGACGLSLLLTPAVTSARAETPAPTGRASVAVAGWVPIDDGASQPTRAVARAPRGKDIDKDGLPDTWERNKTPQGYDLRKLGASWKHKDVFLELEYSTRTSRAKASCVGLDHLYDALRKAPVGNPDGKPGIRLHLDAGKKCASRSYDLGGSSRFTVRNKPGRGLCADPSDAGRALAPRRVPVFRIGAIVAESELCGAEGVAGVDDFVVKDQGGDEFLAYVMLHELGHTFGLDHGPINGFSVMSGGTYAYGSNGVHNNVDFRRFGVRGLDEAALDEHTGYSSSTAAGNTWLHQWYAPQVCNGSLALYGRATGPVDWNCSGAPFYQPSYADSIDAEPVSYDVNGDGVINKLAARPAEWPKVRLDLGRIGR